MAVVQFTLNGVATSVPLVEAERKTLNEYLRFNTQYLGTKLGCGQGGCGACTVAVSRGGLPKSVASCITPLASVHGAAVITVEGIQGPTGEPHPVSERIAKFNGSQCGYCTPGMVMRLYTELTARQGGRAASEAELEHCIDGNICRCTGYRPIIECAKSFANDTKVTNQLDPSVSVGPYDIAKDPQVVLPAAGPLSGSRWRRPSTVDDLKKELANPNAIIMAGGTGAGIYPELSVAEVAESKTWVDITGVHELSKVELQKDSLKVGAVVTWAAFVEALGNLDLSSLGPAAVAAFAVIRERCNTIAGPQVRSSATLGGNIALTRNKGFWSDWVPLLAALGAQVTYFEGGKEATVDLLDFVALESEFKGLLLSVAIPAAPANSVLRSYRVSKRGRNAYALSNAAFLATVDGGKVSKAVLVFGGEHQKPLRLTSAELAFQGVSDKDLAKEPQNALQTLCRTAQKDLRRLVEPGSIKEYHLNAFIVKFLVVLFKEYVPAGWHSAEYCLHDMERRSSATQNVAENPQLGGPFGESSTKTTAVEQAMGRAKYTDDVPRPARTLQATLVLIPEANVTFEGLDAAAAKEVLGDKFHSLVTASDLTHAAMPAYKGALSDMSKNTAPEYAEHFKLEDWHLLPPATPSDFAGQPVAVLLAHSDSPKQVEYAAKRMSAQLKLTRVGAVDIGRLKEVKQVTDQPVSFARGSAEKTKQILDAAATSGGTGYCTGHFEKKSQAHFYMEPQSILTYPDEDGVSVFVAAQATGVAQAAVAAQTGLPQSKVSVKYRRVGGGFGGKLGKTNHMAAMAADVALKVKHAVRLVLPRDTDMQLIGGRQEIEATWRAAVSPDGHIHALEYQVWLAHGCSIDMQKMTAHMLGGAIDMVYGIPQFLVTVYHPHQHVAARTAVRGPGHTEATMLIEAVFNGLATHLKLPNNIVREANFFRGRFNTANLGGGMIPATPLGEYSHLAMWDLLKQRGDWAGREKAVVEFNAKNTFKKRGLSMVPARYMVISGPGHCAKVDVMRDGSVQIAVTGTEVGQGLHTKVGQMVCTVFARTLGAGPPMDKIRFLDTSSEQIPNGGVTGGSTTSETSCYAAEAAVLQLVATLKDHKKAAEKVTDKHPGGLWFDIVEQTFSFKVLGALEVPPLLTAVGMFRPYIHNLMYDTFGVAMAEVELDALTGETKTLYSHVMFDSGNSINPMLDVGQLEGAFMMGLGHQLLEGMDYDPTTGKCLTDNTWTYKPPLACDTPETFVVDLVDMHKDRLENPIVSCVFPAVSKLLAFFGYPWAPAQGESVYKSSKAIGEPPLLLASVIHSALQAAVTEARGKPLDGHMLPIPANSKAVLPLVAGDTHFGSDDSTSATGSPDVSP